MLKRDKNVLTNLLSTGDEADRCYAAHALGKLRDGSAINALVKRLRDEDIDVCVNAVEALGQIGDIKAVPALLESLTNDPSGEVCTVVATALGQLGGAEATAALIKVAAQRPEAIEWIEDGDWDTWWDVQMEAVKALGEAKEEKAVPTLLEIIISNDHQDIESEVLKSLAQIGGAGLDILLKRLQEAPPRARRLAAKALRVNGSTKATRALGQTLKDDDKYVRIAAIHSLTERNASPYLRAILLLLRDQDAEVRSAAINACNMLSVSTEDANRIINDLLPLLSDPSDQVRITGCNTLAALIEDKPLPAKALDAIINNLNNAAPLVRSAACNLLGKNRNSAAIPELIKVFSECCNPVMVRQQAALALGKIGQVNEEIITILTKSITDPEQTIRLTALTVLMALEEANPTKTAEAADKETESKSALECIISALHGQIEIILLKDQSKDEPSNDTETKKNEEHTQNLNLPETARPQDEGKCHLSSLDAIAIDNMRAAFAEEEQEQETTDEEAAHFSGVATQQTENTARIFSNNNPDVAADIRQLAARILGDTNRAEAVNALIEVLKEENEALTSEAIHALGNIANRNRNIPSLVNAYAPLITHLTFGGQNNRLACARTLGKLGHKGAIKALLTALDDDVKDVRTEAINALVQLSLNGFDSTESDHMILDDVTNITVANKIIGCLDDSEHDVMGAAAEGLVSLLELEVLSDTRETIMEKIIEKTFASDGQQARRMGKVVKILDAQMGMEKLLIRLDNAESSYERRFIIEMMEELM